jgi:hypothetical protein
MYFIFVKLDRPREGIIITGMEESSGHSGKHRS